MNKEVRKLVAQFQAAGCEIGRTGSGHVRVMYGGRTVAIIPQSPSDHRSLKNTVRDARRAGVEI